MYIGVWQGDLRVCKGSEKENKKKWDKKEEITFLDTRFP